MWHISLGKFSFPYWEHESLLQMEHQQSIATWWVLGLGLENKSPQIELLRSEPSSSHHIVTIYSSIAHKIKSWICGIGLKDFGRQDQKLIQMQIVP